MRNKYMTALFSVIIFMGSFIAFAYASEEKRGFNSIRIKDPSGQEIDLYKESYALMIGVSNYSNGWLDLQGVKSDIQELTGVLTRQGFNIVVVEDPTHDQLIDAFSDFINRYGLDPDNRLLFFFTGHGYTAKQSYGGEVGYIVPSDAPNPDKDFKGFLQKAIDMEQIEVFARRIQARHALFIFDSCFSGSIFSLYRTMPKNISYKIAKPVRQFITSGSADEEVPDESIFLQVLLAGISGEGDLNQDGYVTGSELGSFLQDSVINYTHGAQHPQFGKIRHPYLNKGDFVFVLDNKDDNARNADQANIEEWKQKLKKGRREIGRITVPLPTF